jgi:hypothetical protein
MLMLRLVFHGAGICGVLPSAYAIRQNSNPAGGEEAVEVGYGAVLVYATCG